MLDESLVILIANERDIVADYDDIREVLNQLAEPARAEALTGFDPSGLGSAEFEALRLDDPDPPTSGNGLESTGESGTSISEFSDQAENQRLTQQTNLSDDQKIQELKLLFQDRFRDNTLTFILKNNGGNLEQAFDELSTRQYLEDEGDLPKGIDGFFAPDEDRPPAKGKGRRAQKGNAKSKKQVVEVAYKAVSSTVGDQELESARDFAQPTGSRGTAPLRRAPASFAATAAAGARPVEPPALSFPVAADFGASDLRAAAALRRMGPLGRQAAAVYTERAREARGASMAHISRAAEMHVNHQSTDTTLDLHGVFVMDGVRIAKQRVWNWWNNLGERRSALAKDNGFTVVTGVGKHSVGGVSRLRKAVGLYLKNDGWKVETLTGSFYVWGRAD